MRKNRRFVNIAGQLLVVIAVLTAVLSPMLGDLQPASAQLPPYTLYIPMVVDTRPNAFGISVQQINDANGLANIIAANANWTRRDFRWDFVEPSEGQRNWGAVQFFDQEIYNANLNNVQVIGIIGSTPAWAKYPGVTCSGKIRSEKFAAFAAFASDLVRRYSSAPYKVEYWELWNEPDAAGILGCWGNPADNDYYGGSFYGEMLKVVYPAMKAADPNVKVMVGGLLLGCDPVHPPVGKMCTDSRFLEGILASGAGNAFDGVAFHAYDYSSTTSDNPSLVGQYSNTNWSSSWNTNGPVTSKKAAYLRSLLTQFGVPQKFLMNTEIAIFCDSSNFCEGNLSAESTKAYYAVQALSTSLADGYTAVIWYSATGGRGNGLFTPSLTPLPAYHSYQFTALKLSQATYVNRPSLPSGVMGYEFNRKGTKVWVVWATSPAVLTSLPSLPTAVYRFGADGLAVAETPSTSVSIGIAPIIIEF